MLISRTYSNVLLSGLAPALFFATQAAAFWRLPCSSPVVVERADPIEQPGAVSRHAHTVMGSDAFNFTMDYAATQRAACSTCKAVEDRSSYWVPPLYYRAENGSFAPVGQAGGALIYYLQRADPQDPEYDGGRGLLAFPEGFRMIAGSPTRRNDTPVDAEGHNPVSFVCLGVDGPATPELPAQNCPGGMRAQLTFPSCWDGVNLDSEDHKSHMAYPSGMDTGYCPPSHPKRFITVFMEVLWNVDEFKDQWYGDKQPFVFSHGDPVGYGYHGDFLNGWDVPTLQRAIEECTDDSGVIERCGAFTFRTDEEMKACRVLPRVREAYSGLLPALPGCNPVQAGPEEAVPQAACASASAAGEIGDPVLPFTDLAAARGWRYAACALDPAGQPRTLGGDSQSGPDATAEGCVAFCGAGGFRYAGVENAQECYCGDSLADDRLQKNGTLGNCDMFPCAGNATQFCGGYGEVGVYEKCDGDGAGCKNMDLPGFW